MFLRSAGLAYPPRPVPAFRVGIVGHRPNRLPKDRETLDALRYTLRCVLEEIQTEVSRFVGSDEAKPLYSSEPLILRAISPLAEGSDRMFAEEAISVGYKLVCPMPFSQEEFEKDFLVPKAMEHQSCERFRKILKYGSADLRTFELDGDRSAEAEAYSAAGRVVLNQSDLLIAVWDGGKPAGDGGTVQTLQEAIHYYVPVFWIDAQAPRAWQLLHSADDLRCLEKVDGRCRPRGTPPTDPAKARALIADAIKASIVGELNLPNRPAKSERASTTKSNAAAYFQESKPWFNFAFVWKLFRDAVGSGEFHLQDIFVRDFEIQISKEWPTLKDKNSNYTPSAVEDWVNRHLRPHYAWSDKRSDMCADAYRSAYVLTYLLSATAVFMALLPMAAGLEGAAQIICVGIEFVILLTIVLLLVVGRRRHWHERWMEYRLLAELIRQIRFLIPLGGGRPFPRVPIHLGGYENLTQTWMFWHMRAIARATGIPPAKVTSKYVLDCLSYIARVVGEADTGQLGFHHKNETCANRIGHRLHAASTILFVLTIVAIGIHLALGLSSIALIPLWLHAGFFQAHHFAIDQWLALAAATLPALGAALAGIANQGEFARLSKRSAAMADAFEQFGVQIKALQSNVSKEGKALKLSQVVPLAGKIAEVMVDEVADWRVVFIDRPPTAA